MRTDAEQLNIKVVAYGILAHLYESGIITNYKEDGQPSQWYVTGGNARKNSNHYFATTTPDNIKDYKLYSHTNDQVLIEITVDKILIILEDSVNTCIYSEQECPYAYWNVEL